MDLIELSKAQIEEIYYQRMKQDFSSNELKPLAMIFKAIDDGVYTCLGLAYANTILAYAFLIKLKNTKDYLIDYIAVKDSERNRGIGSILLEKLKNMLNGATSIIGEVENPDVEEDPNEKAIKIRRYNFYMRNGFVDSTVNVVCFGVPFRLIEIPVAEPLSVSEMKKLYRTHYKALLPPQMYEKNIEV